MKTITIRPLKETLARHPNPDDHWLWCWVCQRFFHLKSVRLASSGEAFCPMPGCHGNGLGMGLLFWDTYREAEDPRWPRSAAELRHGMKSPEMEEFYQGRLRERIDRLVAAFEASREHEVLVGAPCRFVRPFLQMMSDLCWDLTDDDEVRFDRDVARELIQDLPVWAQTAELAEAPPMLAEVRAFMFFAARTQAIRHASRWCELVADDDLVEVFRDTMRRDRRLRPGRRSARRGTVSKAANTRRGSRRKKRRGGSR